MTVKVRVLSFLAAGFIRLLGSTWRLRVIDQDKFEAARELGPRSIYAFWHGRMLGVSYFYRNHGICVLASEHEDGELMGQTIRRLGFGHARGSSTRGGARAIRELVRWVRDGWDIALTVDGPKGPRHVLKAGPLQIAKLTGCPIVPAAVSSARHAQFSSWDDFQLPMPFTRIQVMFGDPVLVPQDATPEVLEAQRQQIEKSLQELTTRNDDSVRYH